MTSLTGLQSLLPKELQQKTLFSEALVIDLLYKQLKMKQHLLFQKYMNTTTELSETIQRTLDTQDRILDHMENMIKKMDAMIEKINSTADKKPE